MVQGYHIYMMLTNHNFFINKGLQGWGYNILCIITQHILMSVTKLLKHLINLLGVKP